MTINNFCFVFASLQNGGGMCVWDFSTQKAGNYRNRKAGVDLLPDWSAISIITKTLYQTIFPLTILYIERSAKLDGLKLVKDANNGLEQSLSASPSHPPPFYFQHISLCF